MVETTLLDLFDNGHRFRYRTRNTDKYGFTKLYGSDLRVKKSNNNTKNKPVIVGRRGEQVIFNTQDLLPIDCTTLDISTVYKLLVQSNRTYAMYSRHELLARHRDGDVWLNLGIPTLDDVKSYKTPYCGYIGGYIKHTPPIAVNSIHYLQPFVNHAGKRRFLETSTGLIYDRIELL